MAIGLSVQLQNDLNSREVHADGFNIEVLDDDHADMFGIPRQVVGGQYNEDQHGQLWGCINNWWGRFPNEFVTGDPVKNSRVHKVPNEWTPYADAWGEENQVRVEMKAVGCRLIESKGSVDSIVTAKVRNYGNTVQPGQKASLAYSEEFEVTRYKENSFGFETTLGYEITVGGEYAGFKAESKYSVSFTASTSHTSGKSTTRSTGKSVELEANVDAEPHSIYPVSVLLGKGSLKVQVDYEYRLIGKWRALYTKKAYNGQLAAPLSDINELLDALDKPRIVRGHEILDIGFVTNGDISIGAAQPL